MAENHYYNFIWAKHEPRIILVRICRYQSSQEGGEDSIPHWCPPDMIQFGWGHFNTSGGTGGVSMASPGEEKSVLNSANQVDFDFHKITITLIFFSSSNVEGASHEING